MLNASIKQRIIVGIVAVCAVILLIFLGMFVVSKIDQAKYQKPIKPIETVTLSGEVKPYEHQDMGLTIDVPKEYMVDDSKFSKDFPYVGFIDPGYEAHIEVTKWPKDVFFEGNFKNLKEYFEFQKNFWKASGFWLEGDPMTIDGVQAYYMSTKFGGGQKKSSIFLEKDGEIYQIKLVEFKENGNNGEILKKAIRSIKLLE